MKYSLSRTLSVVRCAAPPPAHADAALAARARPPAAAPRRATYASFPVNAEPRLASRAVWPGRCACADSRLPR